MTYTINNKTYTEFDINKRCAELMGFNHTKADMTVDGNIVINLDTGKDYNPCNNWNDAGPIIEKIFDELMCAVTDWNDVNIPKWERLIDEHSCTRLVAACICFIELNEGK
ncbi:phage protein NinX family protein [Paraglaciecola sp.]|uniref:phage protein NinX family protein n=1 Tax=Paraglaciecola sp. TaxID=1920173 RepID=UPI003EF1714F